MPLKEVLGALAAPIQVGGSLIAAGLQRKWALQDWQRQVDYNSPVNQVARLKAAGLPLASMFSGSGAGYQSPPIKDSEINSTLGTAEGLNSYFQFELQKRQMQLINAQINKTNEDARFARSASNKNAIESDAIRFGMYKTGSEISNIGASTQNLISTNKLISANWVKTTLEQELLKNQIVKTGQEARKIVGEVDWLNRLGKDGATNQVNLLEAQKRIQNAVAFINENEGQLKNIERQIQDELYKGGVQVAQHTAELMNIFQRNEYMRVLLNDNTLSYRIRKDLSDAISNKDVGFIESLKAILAGVMLRSAVMPY